MYVSSSFLILFTHLYAFLTGASKEQLIAALARSKDKTLAITDGSGGSKRKKMRLQDLPSGYQNFTLSQLKALCASFGWLPATDSKHEILKQIEADIHEHEEKTGRRNQPQMLEAGTAAAPLMILGDEEPPNTNRYHTLQTLALLTTTYYYCFFSCRIYR